MDHRKKGSTVAGTVGRPNVSKTRRRKIHRTVRRVSCGVTTLERETSQGFCELLWPCWRAASKRWLPAPNLVSHHSHRPPPQAGESTMSSTTKPPPKNSRRRKTKSQPVTSGSKHDTPEPSTSPNLNLPLDGTEPNQNSQSGPNPALTDPPSQPASSQSSSSRPQPGEIGPEPVLNVIGTPALPSHSPTPAPAPIPESKPRAKKSAVMPPPLPAPPPPSAAMSRNSGSAAPVPFSVDEEFVAFTFPESDEEAAAVPIREWDQGKQSPDVEKRGKKRKSGEMSRDDREYDRGGRRDRGRDRGGDRYGERRQRMENVPRHAPWIATVDWDRCPNVAEL